MYKVDKIDERTYAFDEGGVRSYLVLGDEKALLIDTGFGESDFKTELPKLTKLHVSMANTHGDGDHTGRNTDFNDRYINRADFPLVRAAFGEETGEYNWIEEGDVFDLGGIKLKVIECPGHSPGSVMLYDAGRKMLFTGDSISEEAIFMFGGHRDPARFASTLERLAVSGLEVDSIMPSHGPYPLADFNGLIGDLLEVMRKWRDGKEPAEVVHMELGPVPERVDVRLYSHGRAKIMTNMEKTG